MGPSESSISPETLKHLVGSGNCPTIIDVRRRVAFDGSPRVIATAQWRDHGRTEDWATSLPSDGAVAVYCVHGHEVSQSAAAVLRACGRRAGYLEGGFEAFEATGGITIEKSALPRERPTPGSRWAISATATIDRLACPWLIRRFVDPLALFLYVAPERLEDVAKEAEAVSCEAVRAEPPTADGSRFEALRARFAIEDPALRRLATVVRGAADPRSDPPPESAGLRAISLGLAATAAADCPGDDRAMTVYDALFARLRDQGGSG